MKRLILVITFIVMVFFSTNAFSQEVVSNIKANGSDGLINIAASENLSIEIQLTPGDFSGDNADWWLVAATPFGLFHYQTNDGSWAPDLTYSHQGPVFNLGEFQVLNISGLPAGSYTLYFGVDMDMNGVLDIDQAYYDFVTVDVVDNIASEFSAVLIETTSKKPVQQARIILAPVNEEKTGCVIDTSLTGVSNESGEVRISNVKPGEYVFFYNVSGILHVGLDGMVVNYNRVNNDFFFITIIETLGPVTVLKGAVMGITDDNQVDLISGYMYAADFDLAMIITEGSLLKITLPITQSPPFEIEINSDIGK